MPFVYSRGIVSLSVAIPVCAEQYAAFAARQNTTVLRVVKKKEEEPDC